MSKFVDFYLIGELVDSHGNVHYEDLKNLPTADVVEVVRCKDCKHSKIADYIPAKCPYFCKLMANCHRGDFFCSMGERRQNNER